MIDITKCSMLNVRMSLNWECRVGPKAALHVEHKEERIANRHCLQCACFEGRKKEGRERRE